MYLSVHLFYLVSSLLVAFFYVFFLLFSVPFPLLFFLFTPPPILDDVTAFAHCAFSRLFSCARVVASNPQESTHNQAQHPSSSRCNPIARGSSTFVRAQHVKAASVYNIFPRPCLFLFFRALVLSPSTTCCLFYSFFCSTVEYAQFETLHRNIVRPRFVIPS